jgi:hypothetical protein
MKKCISRGFAFAAIAGLILTTRAQDTIDQSQFPTILGQPVDQCLLMGVTATFSVQATNTDSYQWYWNNNAIDGQTNANLTISNVSTNNVGYYSVSAIRGSEIVPSRQACLNVYITSAVTTLTSGLNTTLNATTRLATRTLSALDLGGGGVITVFGAPVASNGTSGSCPGSYSGYVNFIKPMSQGWGFVPSTGTTVHTVIDGNRTDTKVQYAGYYGDPGCGATSVTVPDPTVSPKYRFTIYFPRGVQVPTNSYPITLTGFDQ